jgi:hypothetical protein
LKEDTMKNGMLAVVAGLVAFVVIATVAGLIMRGTWPEYAAVADAMTFTLPMMFARLSIGALATLAAGWVAAFVARRSMLAALTTGLILLALFIPQHIMLWARFPVWYHLTFLFSLVPLAYLGGTIASRWHTVEIPRRGPMTPAAQRRSAG